jgi:hypothetical protein
LQVIDQLSLILQQLGTGVLSGSLYDLLKSLASKTTRQDEYTKAIQD